VAIDLQTVFGDCIAVSTPGDQNNIFALIGEKSTEISTDSSRTHYSYPHCQYLIRFIRIRGRKLNSPTTISDYPADWIARRPWLRLELMIERLSYMHFY
jgi:hypothetical protein